MKDDKICFSKTLTYLVLLVAVVFGAFWMMNYTNSTKIGGTPKASTPLSNAVRYTRLDSAGKVVRPSGVWGVGECEYRLRSYKEGSMVLSENAYTGFVSDGANLVEDIACYPYIYAQRDLRYNYSFCNTNFYNEYCKTRSNSEGDVKYGSLFYSFEGGDPNIIYQATATKQAVAGKTGLWWISNMDNKSTSKMIVYNKRMFEGFPAYIVGSNPNFVEANLIRGCTYNGKTVYFNDADPVDGDYFIKSVKSTASVIMNLNYEVTQFYANGNKLTAIKCVPLTSGVANQVSWRSNGGVATNALNKQTCIDNAINTYTVNVGGTPTTKTVKAVCSYKNGSGIKKDVFYGEYIKDANGDNTSTKCDCDTGGKYTYPTFVE